MTEEFNDKQGNGRRKLIEANGPLWHTIGTIGDIFGICFKNSMTDFFSQLTILYLNNKNTSEFSKIDNVEVLVGVVGDLIG